MHSTQALALAAAIFGACPHLALAQDQKPLAAHWSSFLDIARSYIPSNINPVATASSAAAAAASANAAKAAASLAAATIDSLTYASWSEKLAAPPAEASDATNWMILFTGGNKTCQGRCEPIGVAFNESAVLLAASSNSNTPKLARVDCETQGLLCSTLWAGPPTIWYIQRAPIDSKDANGQSLPSTVHTIPLSVNYTTPTMLFDLHDKNEYKEYRAISPNSWFHPFDGPLVRFKLDKPVGGILYALGAIPNWTMMLVASFITRNFLTRRIGGNDEAKVREEQSRKRRQQEGEKAASKKRQQPPLGGAPSADEGYD